MSVDSFAIRNAPITTIATKSSCPGKAVVMPVTVAGFTNVMALSLRIDYDPTIATFVSAVGNINLSGMSVNSVPITPNLAKIIIFWTDFIPRSLAATDTLVKITMNYISGSSAFVFNNTAGGGGDCEYADEHAEAMNDNPTSTYYINGAINAQTVGCDVPANLTLTNLIIPNGQTICYNATQTLTVAGNGTTFLVENGGNATLVAGGKIVLLDGAKVNSGGYFLGHITTDGTYCGAILNPLVTNPEEDQTLGGERMIRNEFFKAYPNPTTGIVFIDMADVVGATLATVTVYSMHGGKLYFKNIDGESKFRFSLEGKPSGIYIVQVQSGERFEIAKIIKK